MACKSVLTWGVRWRWSRRCCCSTSPWPAASLGVRVVPLRRALYALASAAAALAVTTAGSVGFIGLVVPHALRLLPVGPGLDDGGRVTQAGTEPGAVGRCVYEVALHRDARGERWVLA